MWQFIRGLRVFWEKDVRPGIAPTVKGIGVIFLCTILFLVFTQVFYMLGVSVLWLFSFFQGSYFVGLGPVRPGSYLVYEMTTEDASPFMVVGLGAFLFFSMVCLLLLRIYSLGKQE